MKKLFQKTGFRALVRMVLAVRCQAKVIGILQQIETLINDKLRKFPVRTF